MRITTQTHGYEQIEKMLRDIQSGRDAYEDAALIAGAQVFEKALAALPAPRSKGKSRNPKGHMLDHARHLAPAVMGAARGIEAGIQLRRGDGFAYAPIVDRKKPFFIETFNATADRQLDAMQAEIRKGLGV